MACQSEEEVAIAREIAIAKQVEFYFSDQNLPGDKFMKGELRKSDDGKVDLATIVRFNKMKKLLKYYKDQPLADRVAVAATALRNQSTFLVVSEDGTRAGRTTPLEGLEAQNSQEDVAKRTVEAVNLPVSEHEPIHPLFLPPPAHRSE